MTGNPRVAPAKNRWSAIVDPAGRYSSGIPDFDRLLDGGFARGSFALFQLDPSVTPEDRDLVFSPLLLNFLHQSRGIIAVLPARDSPHGFHDRLTRYTTRRRFDGRVRIVDYVGEDEGAAYVVSLTSASHGKRPSAVKKEAQAQRHMAMMVDAERAAQGRRGRSFLEMHAFEVQEMAFGPEVASRMFWHGIKRARIVGNLMLGMARPRLACADALRAMADTEFDLRHDDVGLIIRGIRPKFPDHVVTLDHALGTPHVAFVPSPPAGAAALPVAGPTSSARTRRR